MAEQPVAKIVAGQITAALWENRIQVNGASKTVLKASVQKRYKDRDGTWKSTASFSRQDIPLAVYCLKKAFEKMIEGNGSNGEE